MSCHQSAHARRIARPARPRARAPCAALARARARAPCAPRGKHTPCPRILLFNSSVIQRHTSVVRRNICVLRIPWMRYYRVIRLYYVVIRTRARARAPCAALARARARAPCAALARARARARAPCAALARARAPCAALWRALRCPVARPALPCGAPCAALWRALARPARRDRNRAPKGARRSTLCNVPLLVPAFCPLDCLKRVRQLPNVLKTDASQFFLI
jgi:hypothetical protein